MTNTDILLLVVGVFPITQLKDSPRCVYSSENLPRFMSSLTIGSPKEIWILPGFDPARARYFRATRPRAEPSPARSTSCSIIMSLNMHSTFKACTRTYATSSTPSAITSPQTISILHQQTILTLFESLSGALQLMDGYLRV